MKNTILSEIKNNELHFFHNVLDIIDENNIKSYYNNNYLIFGESNKALESLGRDIIVRTLIQNPDIYTEEFKITKKNKFSDLVACKGSKKIPLHIIEFKHLLCENSEKLPECNSSAFEQIKNRYLNNEDMLNINEIYCSTVIIDTLEILNNSNNLILYLEDNDSEKEISKSDMFEKYGLYIETKKALKNSAGDWIFNNETRYYDLPNFAFIKIKNIKGSNDFNISSTYSEISDAIKLPTSSQIRGVQNVRDIKDPNEYPKKLDILEGIFKTVLKHYKNEDLKALTKIGKEKDFIYLKEDSLLQKLSNDDESSSDEDEKFCLTTLNGSLVDGQNSVDCFRIILDFLKLCKENSFPKKPNKVTKAMKKLQNIMKLEYPNMSTTDFGEFHDMLKKVDLPIKMTLVKTQKEATEIAEAKNTSMPVDNLELKIAENIGRVVTISKHALEHNNVNIIYPKKRTNLIKNEKNNYIDFSKLAKYYNVYSIIKNYNDEVTPHKLGKKWKNQLNTPHGKTDVISNICSAFIQDTVIDKEKNKILKDIIKDKSELINLKKEKNQTEDVSKLQKEVDLLKKELSAESGRSFHLKNEKSALNLGNFLKFCIDLNHVIQNMDTYLKTELNKMNLTDLDSIEAYIFVLYHNKFKKADVLNQESYDCKNDIESILKKFINNLNSIFSDYETDAHQLLSNKLTEKENKDNVVINKLTNESILINDLAKKAFDV